MIRSWYITVLAVFSFCAIFARGAESDRGPLLRFDMSGSINRQGGVYKLNPEIGYRVNRNIEVGIGLPVYFVRFAESVVGTDTRASDNGIGDAYLDLEWQLERPGWYFSSSIRGTAPTGNAETGFSTGRVTFDWSNYLDHSAGRWTPFGIAGIANTVSDTHFFNRPFTSLGLVGHFEGGLSVEAVHRISISGSGYAVTPSGGQKIYNKLEQRSSKGAANPSSGNTKGGNGADAAAGTAGEETKDHGFSAWIDITPGRNLLFEAGYSRSMAYRYNSIFFAVRVDFSRAFRRPRL